MYIDINTFIVLCVGESKAPPVLYPSYSTVYVGRARYTARHVITVIVLAFLTQENKAGKMQSTINQLKYRKGRAVRAIMVLGVVSIDSATPRALWLSRPHPSYHYCTYSTSCTRSILQLGRGLEVETKSN